MLWGVSKDLSNLSLSKFQNIGCFQTSFLPFPVPPVLPVLFPVAFKTPICVSNLWTFSGFPLLSLYPFKLLQTFRCLLCECFAHLRHKLKMQCNKSTADTTKQRYLFHIMTIHNKQAAKLSPVPRISLGLCKELQWRSWTRGTECPVIKGTGVAELMLGKKRDERLLCLCDVISCQTVLWKGNCVAVLQHESKVWNAL